MNTDTGKFDVDYPQPPYLITVNGTATDSDGTMPGIDHVIVSVRNIEHGEYYCGSDPTNHEGGGCWSPTFSTVLAKLGSHGATSTSWSMSFEIYDHPHKYRIVAWAVDRDGQADPTRAVVGRVCVRVPGDDTCA